MRSEPFTAKEQVAPLRRSRNGEALIPGAAADAGNIQDLVAALRARVDGEVRFDAGSRAMYATDASNYRQPPIGVVLPRHADDVVHTVALCREHGVPIVSRGGGTSLAGQTCNTAVVMDFSKYMHKVLDIDPERRLARVQPGVVLDDMKAAAAVHGLTFGPDPATHNHCTLGGMIGNDSCGIHSVMGEFYGPGSRTSDHVQELDIVTYGGVQMRVGATSEDELETIIRGGGPRGEIYRKLRDLRDRYAPVIRARFPSTDKVPRRVSGYNLDALLPENGFHVARALTGTESTCVTILEATIELIRDKPARALVVLGYGDVYQAADHIPQIREFRPVGCEGMDDRLAGYVRKRNMLPGHLELLPEGNGWLLVELGADTREQAVDQARQMMDALGQDPSPPSMRLLDDEHDAARIWEVRESGLGATAFVPGDPDTWPGWEDSAVPPDKVGPYLRDLRALLERYDYGCALYGHFGQGCIHTRIDFDLRSPAGIDAYRRFTDEAADLCLRYGGSLSGEHGDGQSRADLLVKMYGEELVQAFRAFKAIWDPEGQMNPGKVVDAHARTEDLRLDAYHPTPPRTWFSYPEDDGDFSHAAMRCVGVGKCRRQSGGVMCPSYMVTREEKHSTRGRAHLLFEMLQGDVIQDGWQSEEVKDALDLCLACKGCKGDCPVNVDIATYKAEFLAHYYEHERRPRHAYAFGWIQFWSWLAGYVPWAANFVSQTPGLRVLAKAAAGMAPARDIPRFAKRPFQRSVRKRRPRGDGGRSVVLWPDTFNNYFFPDTLMAAMEVLEGAGYRVIVPREHLCCGRPLYDFGMLSTAKRLWERNMDMLGEHIAAGTPLVGLEPSCVSAFRDELPSLFPGNERAARLSENTHTLSELLLRGDGDYQPPAMDARALVQGHCHHKAIMGMDADTEMLSRLGLDFELLDSGCCGMAGAFGFEEDKYEYAMAAGERVLLPAVRNASRGTMVIADGFSCREQIVQGTGRSARHLAEVIREAQRRQQFSAWT